MAPAGYGDSVEGIHAVSAALAAGRVERLYVERGRRGRLGDLLADVDEGIVKLVDDVRDMAGWLRGLTIALVLAATAAAQASDEVWRALSAGGHVVNAVQVRCAWHTPQAYAAAS